MSVNTNFIDVSSFRPLERAFLIADGIASTGGGEASVMLLLYHMHEKREAFSLRNLQFVHQPRKKGESVMTRLEKTMDTVDTSLMRMLREGPEVSLKGSPTVSPMTAAL